MTKIVDKIISTVPLYLRQRSLVAAMVFVLLLILALDLVLEVGSEPKKMGTRPIHYVVASAAMTYAAFIPIAICYDDI